LSWHAGGERREVGVLCWEGAKQKGLAPRFRHKETDRQSEEKDEREREKRYLREVLPHIHMPVCKRPNPNPTLCLNRKSGEDRGQLGHSGVGENAAIGTTHNILRLPPTLPCHRNSYHGS